MNLCTWSLWHLNGFMKFCNFNSQLSYFCCWFQSVVLLLFHLNSLSAAILLFTAILLIQKKISIHYFVAMQYALKFRYGSAACDWLHIIGCISIVQSSMDGQDFKWFCQFWSDNQNAHECVWLYRLGGKQFRS